MKTQEIKILVVDDHDLIRQGLKRLIDLDESITFIGEANNGEKAINMINILKPDVVLLDMKMPILDGLEVLKQIKQNNQGTKVIMLTIENERNVIIEAINIGADGYILKESAGKEVVNAIHTVIKGDKYIDKSLVSILFSDIKEGSNNKDQHILNKLTKREIDVLYYLSKGLSNKEIGEQLYLSEKTIKNYATKLFRKLEINDRVQATIFALNNNIDNFYKENVDTD